MELSEKCLKFFCYHGFFLSMNIASVSEQALLIIIVLVYLIQRQTPEQWSVFLLLSSLYAWHTLPASSNIILTYSILIVLKSFCVFANLSTVSRMLQQFMQNIKNIVVIIINCIGYCFLMKLNQFLSFTLCFELFFIFFSIDPDFFLF